LAKPQRKKTVNQGSLPRVILYAPTPQTPPVVNANGTMKIAVSVFFMGCHALPNDQHQRRASRH